MSVASSPGVDLAHNSQLATSANYLSVYDYSHQYDPEVFMELFPQYGSGLITQFCKLFGAETPFMADKVIHTEDGRLHQLLSGVTEAAGTFTTAGGEAHNLRVNDTVMISDGTNQYQADVLTVPTATTFTVANRQGASSPTISGTCEVFAFSSDWAKKTTGFVEGRTWAPEIFENVPQIIKEFYDIAESDLAQKTWVKTKDGLDKWYALELEKTRKLMLNKQEMTHLFGIQAASGSAAESAGKKGLKGIVPTIEERGNVKNGYISSLADLNDMTRRLRRQGDCTVFSVWADQEQQINFNSLLSGLNAHYSTGINYGLFNNSKDMSMYLDFKSVYVNGMSFFLTNAKVLDDPTLLGATNFLATGTGGIVVPMGEKMVSENGEKAAKPYISIRYRKSGAVDRYLRTKIFGIGGVDIRKDAMEIEYITEQTNQVVGSNEFFVIQR